jgi:hypothetical protein
MQVATGDDRGPAGRCSPAASQRARREAEGAARPLAVVCLKPFSTRPPAWGSTAPTTDGGSESLFANRFQPPPTLSDAESGDNGCCRV